MKSGASQYGGWSELLSVDVVPLLVLGGVVLRIAQFLVPRGLEMDEQMLAANVLSRSFGDLLGRPLDFQQVAAPGFLLLERSAFVLFGANEYAFHLVPALAGLAALLLLPVLCTRLGLGRRVTLSAVALFAVSPMLLTYAGLMKPYSSDALATTLILVASAPFLVASAHERRRWWTVIAVGVLVLTISLPCIFVLAGVLAARTVRDVRSYRDAAAREVIAAAIIWGALFLAIWTVYYRPVSDDACMRWFWQGSYLADHPSVRGAVAYIASGITSAVFWFWRNPGLEIYLEVLFPLLALIGALGLLRGDRYSVAIALVTPLFCAAAASGVGRYIFAERLLLFAVPCICVLVACGINEVTSLAPRLPGRLAFALLSAAVVLPALRHSIYPLRHPETWGGAGALAREAKARAGANGVIYLYARAIPGWIVYANDWSRPDLARVQRQLQFGEAIGCNSGNVPPRGHAVVSEGETRVDSADGHHELYGIATGTGRGFVYVGALSPDSGWAENEAGRIRRAGGKRVVLYASEFRVPAQLLTALTHAGGRETVSREIGHSHLYQYDFPSGPAGPAATAQPSSPIPLRR